MYECGIRSQTQQRLDFDLKYAQIGHPALQFCQSMKYVLCTLLNICVTAEKPEASKKNTLKIKIHAERGGRTGLITEN